MEAILEVGLIASIYVKKCKDLELRVEILQQNLL